MSIIFYSLDCLINSVLYDDSALWLGHIVVTSFQFLLENIKAIKDHSFFKCCVRENSRFFALNVSFCIMIIAIVG